MFSPGPFLQQAGLAVVLAALAVPASAMKAQAYDENPRQWGRSSSPYRQVGTVNKELSSLCRAGQFNQRKIGEYYISFDKDGNGDRSSDLVGIAKKNYNLNDPGRKADPTKTYHFHNDGTSQCRVYVAP